MKNFTFTIRHLLAVLLMAIPISAWCGTDAETYYGISLFGEEISSNNLTGTIPSSFGTGSYSFDPATRTLTITNMLVNMNEELVGLKGGIIESAWAEGLEDWSFTVKFVGTNKASGIMAGILMHHPGSITITGEEGASISLYGDYYMLRGDITLDMIDAYFSAKDMCVDLEALTVKNYSSVSFKGSQVGYVYGLTMDDNIKITTPGVTYVANVDDKGFYKQGAFAMQVSLRPIVKPNGGKSISSEITMTPSNDASYEATVETADGLIISLDEDDEFNRLDDFVTLKKTLTAEQVKELLASVDPLNPDFYDVFKGLYFERAAGKGYMEVTFSTFGNSELTVMNGNEKVAAYSSDTKETVRIDFDSTADEWTFLFPSTKALSANSRRDEVVGSGVCIYSIKVVPTGPATGINKLNTAKSGTIYNLAGQRISVNSELTKGVYIVDGQKVWMK